MTRINCVPPSELSRQHLLAEWRELPRVFTLAQKAYAAGRFPKAPSRYTLGAGHVLFFYQRLGYCFNRFMALRREMLRRGYEPQYVQPPVTSLPAAWWGEWEPDEVDLAVNRQRIQERNEVKK